MDHVEKIKQSQFVNTYGGLSLVMRNGERFLVMEDCICDEYFGPLTDEQVAAFDALCEVPANG